MLPVIAALLFTMSARAEEFQTPIGAGAMISTDDTGRGEPRFALEAEHHFKQRRDPFGLRRYGRGGARAEIGSKQALSLAATAGFTLLGLGEGSSVAPHVGIEPVSGRIRLATGGRKNYYEWLPMLSLGLQAQTGHCRILPLARGGLAAGTYAVSRFLPAFGPAYGLGLHLNCLSLDLGVEVTRLHNDGRAGDLALVDLAIPSGLGALKLGLRGESERLAERSERRLLLVLRGELAEEL